MSNLDARQVGGAHYTSMSVQPWAVMESCMSAQEFAGYLQGNCIKYLMRFRAKGGVTDLQKAQHYLEKLIAVEQNK